MRSVDYASDGPLIALVVYKVLGGSVETGEVLASLLSPVGPCLLRVEQHDVRGSKFELDDEPARDDWADVFEPDACVDSTFRVEYAVPETLAQQKEVLYGGVRLSLSRIKPSQKAQDGFACFQVHEYLRIVAGVGQKRFLIRSLDSGRNLGWHSVLSRVERGALRLVLRVFVHMDILQPQVDAREVFVFETGDVETDVGPCDFT